MTDKARPWLPDQHPPRKPPPVPVLGWCARCQRVNPRLGYPEDHDGHDWAAGVDSCAYVAGVICPECITPDDLFNAIEEGIFIDPNDGLEADL